VIVSENEAERRKDKEKGAVERSWDLSNPILGCLLAVRFLETWIHSFLAALSSKLGSKLDFFLVQGFRKTTE
jgi:hypothetical protein